MIYPLALQVLLVVLGLFVAVLALIGFMGAIRSTPVDCVNGFVEGQAPSVRDPLFRRTMEFVSMTRLCPGHEVRSFVNGDETYPVLWGDLRSARETITMQMYYCNPGRMADELKAILCERARAGVQVRFLYDAFGSSLPAEYFRELEIAGVQTNKFRPIALKTIHKITHRSHIRVVVVDGRIGWTGGFGIDDKWYGSGRTPDEWRDSNVRFTGPCVSQLQAAFVACWAEACGTLLVGEELFPAIEAGEGPLAAVLHNAPSVGTSQAERFFALSISCARERLYITNSYFVPDPEFREMMSAAARRGVDVRVLTTGRQTDVRTTLHAGRARYEELLEAGVRIYEYQASMLHAKTLVVDSYWSAVGSMNADNRSLAHNEEVVMFALDEGVAAQVEGAFFKDLEYAVEFDLERFRERGLWPRLQEKASDSIWRLL